MVVAAQRSRRTREWLRERTPADGLIAGIGTVNGDLFDDERARILAIHYDYTVFAGTQGNRNHYKQDRMYELARPYARAVFELAKQQGRFQDWSDKLMLMAAVVGNPTMQALLDNPRLTRADTGELVIRACGEDLGDHAVNLLRILAENSRLFQLPMIAALYSELRDEAEGTIEADVVSASPLSDEQKSAIASALKKRLGRDVQLNCSVNEDLVGGAVIRAGDLVIDGSAVEHLRQLANALVH